jgi:hypothetical protein
LFNLRLSSDAPNLQVENEETIEALSARTKALLDGIQQRFLFARSIRNHSYRSKRFARLDDRRLTCFRELSGTQLGALRGAPFDAPQPRAEMSLTGGRFSPSVFISFYCFLVRGAIGARAWTRSFSSDRCALACQLDPFSKIIVSAVSAGRKTSAMTTRFLA